MKVSVLLVTYNHERYIEQAIESVLAQTAPFEYEVIISEDCSTDRTREIVAAYCRKYSERIRTIFSEKNLCDNEVLLRAWRAARGEYITLLDGDDYWTSTAKLRKQTEFLDRNSGFSICHHPVTIVSDNGSEVGRSSCRRSDAGLADLLKSNFIATASAMYRRGLIGEIPAWQNDVFAQDWALSVLFALHGRIGCLKETMAAYRVHAQGIHSGMTGRQHLLNGIAFYEHVRHEVPKEFGSIISRGLARLWGRLAYEYRAKGDSESAKAAIESGRREYRWQPELLASDYAPAIYDRLRNTRRAARRASGRPTPGGF